jgi:excisionase family DNA binding protein
MPPRSKLTQNRTPPTCDRHPLHSVESTGCPMCNAEKATSNYLGADKVDMPYSKPDAKTVITPEPTKTLTVSEAAKHLCVAPRTVMKWVDNGRLKASKGPSGIVYIGVDDLAAFMIEHAMAVPAELKALTRSIEVLPEHGPPLTAPDEQTTPVAEPTLQTIHEARWKGSVCSACGNEECYGTCPGYAQWEKEFLESERRKKGTGVIQTEPAGDTYFSQDVSAGNGVESVGEWKTSIITIETDKGKKQKVKAKLLGYVAVHDTLKRDTKDPNYTLTAAAVGLVIAQLDIELDCQRMGHFLMSKCAYALSRKTREDIVKKMPDWVLAWIRICRAERKYVEPKYIEQGG